MAPPGWTYYVSAIATFGALIGTLITVLKFRNDLRDAEIRRIADREKQTEQERLAIAQRQKDERTRSDLKAQELIQRAEATALATRDLRWRQSQAAFSMVEKMNADPVAYAVCIMIDWSQRAFPLDAPLFTISTDEFAAALRPHNMHSAFSDKETYIRDSVDGFLWYLELIEQQIEVDLVTLDDVRFPIGYFVKRLRAIDTSHNTAVTRYLQAYEFEGTLSLIARFDASDAEQVGSSS